MLFRVGSFKIFIFQYPGFNGLFFIFNILLKIHYPVVVNPDGKLLPYWPTTHPLLLN